MAPSLGSPLGVRMPGAGHLYAAPAPLDLAALEEETLELAESDLPPTPGRSAGERIARRFFELCESPRTRARTMNVLRASADSAVGGRLLVALLSRVVFRPALRSRRLDHAAARFELVAAQLGGIAVLRYVSRMEPIASMSVDDLVGMVAPSIQATLSAGR